MSNRKPEFSLGETLYPSPTAGDGKQVVDKYTGRVDGWHCQQCGFWCSAERVTVPGTMNEGDGFLYFTPVSGASNTSEAHVSPGGCPFCGTANSR